MGSAFLLPNAQSFSSGDRDSPTQPGRRYEMAAGCLYQAVQHSPQVLRPRLCRALQGADRGWQWQRPPQNGLRLRASQSSESQIDPAGSGTGDFPVDQLWRVSQAGGQTSALAAGGPVAGRARDPEGQLGRPGTICPANGASSDGGRRGRLQIGSAGLVPGE